MTTFMKIGIGKKRKSFQANSLKKVFSVGDFPGVDFICVSLPEFPEVEGMPLDRGVVSLKEEGEFQLSLIGGIGRGAWLPFPSLKKKIATFFLMIALLTASFSFSERMSDFQEVR